MHMVPVLFALTLIIVADRKSNSRMTDTQSNISAEPKRTSVTSIKNYVFLNPTDITQVVIIYKVSRLALKAVR